LWRREKLMSLLQFEPWTIQTVEQTLYTPRYSGSQNIILKQVMADGWTLLFYNLEGNPATVVQEAGEASGPVLIGAENLVPTLGFNPQTVHPVARRYTDVMKAYRGSRCAAPL
jgi:hypothetical protein